jgi:hypothetical protein
MPLGRSLVAITTREPCSVVEIRPSPFASRRLERATDVQAVGRSNVTYSTIAGLPLIHSAPNRVPGPIGPEVSFSTRLVLGFHSSSLVMSVR